MSDCDGFDFISMAVRAVVVFHPPRTGMLGMPVEKYMTAFLSVGGLLTYLQCMLSSLGVAVAVDTVCGVDVCDRVFVVAGRYALKSHLAALCLFVTIQFYTLVSGDQFFKDTCALWKKRGQDITSFIIAALVKNGGCQKS